jgi:HAD superfamily hydrolase (TIGR01490 family)
MIAALFDIEGTLFTKPMGRGLVDYARSHGRGLQAAGFFSAMLAGYPLARLGWIDREAYNRSAVEGMAGLVRGYDRRTAEAAFDWVADEFIFPSARKEILGLWEEHRRAGHLLLIVSGGLAPVVERLGARLGAAGTAGTEMQVRDGRCTGRLASPIVNGREKAVRARNLVSALGADVDWGASSAYADSFSDLQLLELVGRPVAVDPDRALQRVARERGWRIVLPAGNDRR